MIIRRLFSILPFTEIENIDTLRDPKAGYYDKKAALRGLGIIKQKELPENSTLNQRLQHAAEGLTSAAIENAVFGRFNEDYWRKHHGI